MNQQPRKIWLRIATKFIHGKGPWKVVDKKQLVTICEVPSSTASAEIAALCEVHGFKEKKTLTHKCIFRFLNCSPT